MGRTVAIANQKGGVGKTAAAQAAAALFKRMGLRALAVDLDPQGSLTHGFGADPGAPGAYEVILGEAPAKEAVQRLEAFDAIAADMSLASAERALSRPGRELLLREALGPLKAEYDWIVLDTQPSLGFLTVSALAAADEAIVPTAAGVYAAKGINELASIVAAVKKYFSPDLFVRGVLMSRFSPRTINSREMLELTEMVAARAGAPVFKSRVRESVAVGEAQARGKDIFSHAPKSAVAADYAAFVGEWLEMAERGGGRGEEKI